MHYLVYRKNNFLLYTIYMVLVRTLYAYQRLCTTQSNSGEERKHMRYWYEGLVWLFHITRRGLGLTFLFLSLVGALLPLVPGLPCFMVALFLLGRRDRTLRTVHVMGRQVLRWLRRSRQPLLRQLGVRLSHLYIRIRPLMFLAAPAYSADARPRIRSE